MKKNVIILLLGWLMCFVAAAGVTVAVYNGLHRHSHRYESEVIAPTCTEKGYTLHTCECGNSYKDNYIDATGHSYEDGKCGICGYEHPHEYEKSITPPTCQDKGYTTYSCICGVSYTADETDIVDHNYVNGKCSMCGIDHDCVYTPTVTPPTCTASGFTTYACTCGASYIDNYTDPLDHDYENGICKVCKTAHGHDFDMATVAPTCTEQGYTTYYCDGCGYSYNGDYTDALDHNFVNGECTRCHEEHDCEYTQTVTDPTCTEQGYTTHTCTCGASYVDDYIDALSHNFVNGECTRCHEEHDCEYTQTVNQPTCTEQGYTTHTCTCGNSYTDDYVDALGHNYQNGECERCGKEMPRPESVSLNKTSLYIKKGNSETLTASILPADAFDQQLIWSSSDENTVTVENGVVTAVEYGSATVTVTTVDGNKTARCSVTVGEFRFFSIYENGKVVAYSVDSYEGMAGSEVIIPSSYNGKPVTEIRSLAFFGSDNIVSVTIPDSVKVIASNAFSNCRGLKSIEIPDSVTTIEKNAFIYCRKLTDINIPDSVTFIGESAFQYCYSVKSISIGKGVASIGSRAFAVGYNTYGSMLESITVDEENQHFYSKNNCLIERENNVLLFGCFNSVIPEGITEIAEYAFHGCNQLTDIHIPATVNAIGNNAFSYCSGLTSIEIPDSVTTIEKYAFSCCSSLTSINIPDGVTSIGDYVFYNCRSLTSINIPESVTSIGKYSFNDCENLTSINLPDGVTSIGNSAFSGCNKLTSIKFPNKLTTIENRAFAFCYGLTNIVMPDSLISIGSDAFLNCIGLTNVVIPNSVTTIGSGAFSLCWKITEIVIPASVISIGAGAFSGGMLDKITVADGNAKYYSKNNCVIERGSETLVQGSNSSVIFDGIKVIGAGAFEGSRGFTTVKLPNSVTTIGNRAFTSCSDLTTMVIPESVTSIGDSAFMWCHKLTSVTISDSVTEIKNSTFLECTSLTSITISGNVTSIGASVFRRCSALKSINFNGTKAEWLNIEKGSNWDDNTGNYTVHCTDGDIEKE